MPRPSRSSERDRILRRALAAPRPGRRWRRSGCSCPAGRRPLRCWWRRGRRSHCTSVGKSIEGMLAITAFLAVASAAMPAAVPSLSGIPPSAAAAESQAAVSCSRHGPSAPPPAGATVDDAEVDGGLFGEEDVTWVAADASVVCCRHVDRLGRPVGSAARGHDDCRHHDRGEDRSRWKGGAHRVLPRFPAGWSRRHRASSHGRVAAAQHSTGCCRTATGVDVYSHIVVSSREGGRCGSGCSVRSTSSGTG